MTAVKPRTAAPVLDVPTLSAGRWNLADRTPPHFSMIVFYRGLHCPVCKSYLRDVDGKLDAFTERGVDVVAVSCDDEDRARQTAERWQLGRLALGYGLSIEQARAWGLYISAAISDKEPALFCEPGLMLVRPDGTLYAASIQTMPFARPQFDGVLSAIGFITDKSYPARGEA